VGKKEKETNWSGNEEEKKTHFPSTNLVSHQSLSPSLPLSLTPSLPHSLPLSLIRTRLQAAGTPAHPQMYLGFWDAAQKTYRSEGVVGFYRGLVPTLAKVVPAVSISYVVYEHSKRHLGVQ
jgi:hypothetical protein